MNKDNIDLVLKCEDPKKFVELAEKKTKKWNRNKRNKISSSQLRNLYEYVLKVDDVSDKNLVLLKPKLVYIKKRNNLDKDFVNFISNLISNINSNKELENFKDFFEAIVAYNKEHGDDKK